MLHRACSVAQCLHADNQSQYHFNFQHCPILQLFKERLGLIIEGEDEMACAVEGCNFLLNAGVPSRSTVFGLCHAGCHAAASAMIFWCCHNDVAFSCLHRCLQCATRLSSLRTGR